MSTLTDGSLPRTPPRFPLAQLAPPLRLDPVAFASLSSATRQKRSEPPVHRGWGTSAAGSAHQKKSRSPLLTFVLIGDRSPSILVESSCQVPSSPSYPVCGLSLSIPQEESRAGSLRVSPRPRPRPGGAASVPRSNLNLQCLESAVPGEARSRPRPLPSPASLSPELSPPSFSSLSFHHLPRAPRVRCSLDK